MLKSKQGIPQSGTRRYREAGIHENLSLLTGVLPKYRNGKKARIPSIGHTKDPAILSV
jgi:hypothetical protein